MCKRLKKHKTDAKKFFYENRKEKPKTEKENENRKKENQKFILAEYPAEPQSRKRRKRGVISKKFLLQGEFQNENKEVSNLLVVPHNGSYNGFWYRWLQKRQFCDQRNQRRVLLRHG